MAKIGTVDCNSSKSGSYPFKLELRFSINLFIVQEQTLHTTTNRITGLLLFLFPVFFMCVQKDDLIAVLCVVATFAAIQEGHYIACCYYVYKENDNNGSN